MLDRNHQRLTIAWLACLLALLWSGSNWALPQESRVPGGIAIIPLDHAEEQAPEAYYNDSRVLIVAHEDRWKAIVGIPLDTEPGTQTLQLRDGKINFQVQAKAYPEEHLTVQQRYVSPNPEQLARIRQDQVRLRAALNHFSTDRPSSLQMQRPIQGRESSPFGLRRIFNGEPRRPHSGLDLAAPTGTTILAPAAGRVIESGDFYFNGNTVLLDHGNGLITMYCHMDKILVSKGQQLRPGEPLGEVGATGRVTGPHLHWGVTLNGVMVDPSLFLRTSKTP